MSQAESRTFADIGQLLHDLLASNRSDASDLTVTTSEGTRFEVRVTPFGVRRLVRQSQPSLLG